MVILVGPLECPSTGAFIFSQRVSQTVAYRSSAASAAPVLGRTHLGSFPPCEDQPFVLRSPPSLFRPDHGATGGSQPPRPPDGFVRLAGRERGLAGPFDGRPARPLGPRRDPR